MRIVYKLLCNPLKRELAAINVLRRLANEEKVCVP